MVQHKKKPNHKESKIEYKTFYNKKCERVPLYELKRGDSDIYLVQKIIALKADIFTKPRNLCNKMHLFMLASF